MSAASYGKSMIESRKRADNAYKEMDTVIANDKKILQIANFETFTANKIDRLVKSVWAFAITSSLTLLQLIIAITYLIHHYRKKTIDKSFSMNRL
jgi:hypothetical protein